MAGTVKTLHLIFIKYKLLHVLYWLLVFADLMHSRMQEYPEPFMYHVPDVIISTGTMMLCVYTIVYFLVPKFLKTNRIVAFVVFTFIAIIITAILYTFLLDLYSSRTTGNHLIRYYILVLSHFVEVTLNAGVFLAVVLLYAWAENNMKNRKIEKEKLEAELNYLKAQINPHFLFNALNSIYVLIDLDKKHASETLLKFADLLRYQLYECASNDISVDRELAFIDDYVQLGALRYGEYVIIEYGKPERVLYFPIAPLLLVPFVENAFKYVSKNPAKQNFIKIKASVKENVFVFSVQNTFDKLPDMKTTGGIGLQNVKRRLELLYPEKHELSISSENDIFSVKLTVYAGKNELHYH